MNRKQLPETTPATADATLPDPVSVAARFQHALDEAIRQQAVGRTDRTGPDNNADRPHATTASRTGKRNLADMLADRLARARKGIRP